jgi:GAF domain-containing protein
MAGGRTFGTLNVGNSSPNAFDQQDEGLLLQVASLVATTFESRRLFLETQERAEELAVISQLAQSRADELAILNQMGQELTSLADIKSLLSSVHHHVSRLMEVENYYLAIYDESLDMVDIHMFGEGEEIDPASLKRKGGQGITEYVIRTNQSLLFEDNVAERVAELGVELYGRVAESWVGVPMTSGNQVIGMMAVQNFTKPGIYGEHERELLTAVANQTAIAIENSNLFEQEQARARREQILREITARVRGSTDVDTVMRTAAQEVGRALGRQTFVYLSDGEEENPNESNE